ncbi:MAG: T9SS type A sorting domain-containing protein [Bacteroidetes bacterium]|nr:T9SS type A sorting domain-containing protein [Bacteroidota bacterium]
MRGLYIFILCLFALPGKSQDTLNVLPVAGANELFHTFLIDRGAELWDARRDSVDVAILSAQGVLDRQVQLKEDYIALLGEFPEKTPLNAEITETLQGDGYYIEILTYESQPNHHVTANFYIPDTGDGPFPTVIILCGHYPVGKGIGLYQELSALFAQNGIAALIVDPFSQGERAQIQNPDNGNLMFAGQSGTGAHSRLDVGTVLTGTSVTAQALWDNHRGMDYIYSRTDVVDTTRLGCTGSSGGGSQATYLSAFDDRIKVAAVNSFLMNEETLYSTIGPQTASQNLSYEGAHLIDHPDYITMFAPKPYMILAATDDFFDIGATIETYNEALEIYTALGEADKIGFFEEIDAEHGYMQERREEAVKWFKTWFFGDDSEVVEADITTLSSDALWATETGQVVTEFADEKTLTDLMIERTDQLAPQRDAFWADNTQDSCLNKVRELIRFEDYEPITAEEGLIFQRDGYTVTQLQINSGDNVPVVGLMFIPDGLTEPAPAVLYVDGRGKNIDAADHGVIDQVFADSGKIVLTIDVRGFGETADNPAKNESKHGNKEHRNHVISTYIGKTLIGQRVEDVMKALDLLLATPNVDENDVTIIGVDRAGPVALHTAALDDRITHTQIMDSFDSWIPMVGNPTELHNMTHVVPFALEYYDLTHLADAAGSVEFFEDPYEVVSSTKEASAYTPGQLHQNFPNPAVNQTNIPFQLKESGEVSIRILDMQGKMLGVHNIGQKMAGQHKATISLNGIPAGNYIYQLFLNGQPVASKKMIVVYP